jgi:hypothetical protein
LVFLLSWVSCWVRSEPHFEYERARVPLLTARLNASSLSLSPFETLFSVLETSPPSPLCRHAPSLRCVSSRFLCPFASLCLWSDPAPPWPWAKLFSPSPCLFFSPSHCVLCAVSETPRRCLHWLFLREQSRVSGRGKEPTVNQRGTQFPHLRARAWMESGLMRAPIGKCTHAKGSEKEPACLRHHSRTQNRKGGLRDLL